MYDQIGEGSCCRTAPSWTLEAEDKAGKGIQEQYRCAALCWVDAVLSFVYIYHPETPMRYRSACTGFDGGLLGGKLRAKQGGGSSLPGRTCTWICPLERWLVDCTVFEYDV